MKMKKFAKKVSKLADYTSVQPLGVIPAMWVAEEGAEVLKCYKSAMKDGEAVDDKELKMEIGDTLTALANLANEKGFDFKEIMRDALDKLAERTGKSLDDEED